MSKALYNRLKVLRDGRGKLEAASQSAGRPAEGHLELPGWKRIAPGVFHRIVREDAGSLLSLAGSRESYLFPPPEARIVFFDCETTGLSGGAGNLIFLFGLGYLEEGSLVVEQLFLEDFPDEPYFLEEIAGRLSRDYVYVSYNGRTFDANILRTRFLLNGIPFPIRRQVDLLYPVRRLWRRRLESCSLGNVERGVLGIIRQDDVSGAEVPERYFTFLRSGDPAPLSPVFSHHAYDISSLVRLADAIDLLATGSFTPPPAVADGLGLATFLCAGPTEEARQKGIARLERLLEEAKTSQGPWRDGLFVGRRLARHYRLQGAVDRLGRVWEIVYGRAGGIEAAVEYAKYLEHHKRRFAEAVAVVERALQTAEDGPTRRALEHRRARLIRKIASQA
jgi:hypothetical protein